ncbi:efflux RND transporter permease subunit [Helicobacter canis]|uniref:SSD domain-containing protein n=1 Tax=Helicobacter canis NCTC 12740 TaxID=1357399 RepID=V8CEV2_9HELI|nr:efflux RND transporter permease subunit [Helicobacter canis]ETD25894.1 hypothetical protein HMPREF2087_01728 [Helicobacter canis NCTC 12740]
MNIVAFFLTRPVFASVVAIFITLFGCIAFMKIPYQLLPQTTRPMIGIYTYYAGASPYEIEKEIIQKQEAKLKNLKNLQTITATMRDGIGIVNLEFGLESDLRSAFVEVSAKLEEITGYPEGVQKPIVKTTGETIPISVYLFVSLQEAIFSIDQNGSVDVAIDAYKDIIENEVLPHYERIAGVGEVILAGGVQPQVQIVLNTAQLAFNNITIQDIINAINKQNHNISAGSIDFDQHTYRVQTIGEYRSLDEVLNTIIRVQNGKITRLKDIASVQQGYSRKTSYNRHNREQVLSIQIRPTADANILEMTESIKALTQRLNDQVLPKELEITWGRDQSGFILNAISQVKQSVLLGMVLAIAVLLLFLRNGISLIILSLVIPLSIIGTFVVLHIFGRTLNIISLAGISFAISMVIDSAIVVLESIIRNRTKKPDSPVESTLTGVREVIGALFASSITTIAIFVPILYLKDEAGQLFADIGIAASSAIVLAFVICILIVPAFLLLFLKESKKAPSPLSQKIGAFGLRCSERIMHFVYKCVQSSRARFYTIAGFLGFCLIFSYFTFPKTDYLPRGEQNFIIAYISTAPGLSYNEKRYIVDQISLQIEPFVCRYEHNALGQELKDTCVKSLDASEQEEVPMIKNFYIGAGSSISFYLIAQDPKQSGKLIKFAKQAIEQVPGVSGVVLRQQVFSGASSSSIDINVSGDSLESITAATREVRDHIKERFSDMSVRVVPSLASNNREINLYPNDFALLENGLDVPSFGNIVSVLLGGKSLGSVKINDAYMDLILQFKDSNHSPEDILYAPIYAPNGKIVMLGALSEVQSTLGVSTIRHFEQKRNLLLIINPSNNTPLEEIISTIRADIIPPIAKAYPDLQITLNGNADKLSVLKGELLGGFLLAVMITYLILCALYGNFFYPLLIIASVPLAVSGGLMGLFFTNHFIAPQNLDVITMLGFIILVGSVVNNAILIIYQARINYHDHQMPWTQSVLDSTKTRLSPIYMSMLTSVLALLPLVVFAGAGSEIYRGLGSVLIGGLMFASIVSVFIIPAMLLSIKPKS